MGQVHRKYVVAKPVSITGQQLAPQPVISRYVIFYEGRGKMVGDGIRKPGQVPRQYM